MTHMNKINFQQTMQASNLVDIIIYHGTLNSTIVWYSNENNFNLFEGYLNFIINLSRQHTCIMYS